MMSVRWTVDLSGHDTDQHWTCHVFVVLASGSVISGNPRGQ
jgi:hypothetical protein